MSYGQEKREILLHELRTAINVLMAECLSPPVPVTNSTKGAAAFCTVIEAALSHCFNVTGRNYWYFVKKALRDKGLCHRETLIEVRKAWWAKNEVLGKGRMWVCSALNAEVLFECLQVMSYESLSEWYDADALFRNSHDLSIFFQLLMPIYDLQFELQLEESLFSHVFEHHLSPKDDLHNNHNNKNKNSNSKRQSLKIRRRGVILDAEEDNPPALPTGGGGGYTPELAKRHSHPHERSKTIDAPPNGLTGIPIASPPSRQPGMAKLVRRNTVQNGTLKDEQQQQQHKKEEKKGWAPEIQRLFQVGSYEERLKMIIQNNNIEKILAKGKRDTNAESEDTSTQQKQPVQVPPEENKKKEEEKASPRTSREPTIEYEKDREKEVEVEPERTIEKEESHNLQDQEIPDRKENNEDSQPTTVSSSFEHRIFMNRQAKAQSRSNTITDKPSSLSFEREVIPSTTTATTAPKMTYSYDSSSSGSGFSRSLLAEQLSIAIPIYAQESLEPFDPPQPPKPTSVPLAWGKGEPTKATHPASISPEEKDDRAQYRQKSAMAIPGQGNQGRASAASSYSRSVGGGGEVISNSFQDKILDSCEHLVDFLSSSFKNKAVDSKRASAYAGTYKTESKNGGYNQDYGHKNGVEKEEPLDDEEEEEDDDTIIQEFIMLRWQVLSNASEPGADPVGENKARWQEAVKCMECRMSFTAVRRRHHCRNCGSIVCRRCSAHRCVLNGFYLPTRVCNTCWGMILDSSIKSALANDEDLMRHTL